MKQFLAILLLIFVLLGSNICFAQDSLRLMATLKGERECASAGDVNGDGFKDIVTGNLQGNGYVKIYLGGVNFDTIPDLTITGDGGAFGCAVASAGDLNRDGYDDIIVGARATYKLRQGHGAGKACIFFGGDPMDNTVDLVLEDSRLFFRYGSSVCSAGDLNNDGYDDVLVAAPEGMDARGRAYVYFGAEDMDTLCDLRILGHSDSSEHLGRSIAGIGDINSDGYDDILIGSPYAGGNLQLGKASVYFGGGSMDSIPDLSFWGDSKRFQNFGAKVASAGDLDGDGIPDILIGNSKRTKIFFGGSLSEENSQIILPEGKSISSAGDLNKDGYGDIIISGGKDPEKCYIFYGGTEMDGEADIILKAGDTTFTDFGLKVVGLGDINGDGYDEIMISSKGNSIYYGIAYIYTSNPALIQEEKTKEE